MIVSGAATDDLTTGLIHIGIGIVLIVQSLQGIRSAMDDQTSSRN